LKRGVTVSAWSGLCAATPAGTQARAQAQPGGGLKIAFISSQQVLEQTPGYAAAESTFKKEYQGFQDEAQKLRQQFGSAVQTFEKQSIDRKSTRLNSSHSQISYAVFCLKKKNQL